MQLIELVEKENIIFLNGDFTKDEIIKKFGEILSKDVLGLSSDKIYNALIEREKLGSTAVGEEVAIPHAKLDSISKASIAIAVSRNGIDFDAPDKLAVKLFFVVLSPESDIAGHLKTLARISRLVKMTDFKSRVLSSSNMEEVLEILKEEESKV
ncbi:MAG: putative IIA-like nitrogen-regulatory protein PtsN [Deferribacteraceae bacterium]|jgi:PTS system nitrogen regulatory IIA component|nr:putative IIA-like nitrogen-regulatory protein PtsN [Deferribacteraceae bacterium]